MQNKISTQTLNKYLRKILEDIACIKLERVFSKKNKKKNDEIRKSS